MCSKLIWMIEWSIRILRVSGLVSGLGVSKGLPVRLILLVLSKRSYRRRLVPMAKMIWTRINLLKIMMSMCQMRIAYRRFIWVRRFWRLNGESVFKMKILIYKSLDFNSLALMISRKISFGKLRLKWKNINL